MKWEDLKREITHISESEKRMIEQKARVINTIVQRRRMLGMTQEEVAEKTGLTQSVIARLESSSHVPRFDTLQKVAQALGLRFELIEDMDEKAAASEVVTVM